MTKDSQSQSQSSLLAHLRHELRTPINAIVGYSEMLLEDIEDIKTEVDREGIFELEQIRDSGRQLLSLVNTLLNSTQLEDLEFNLEELISNTTVQTKLQTPTKVAINFCQQLLTTAKLTPDFLADIQKINQAAERLLMMTEDLMSISQISTTHLESQSDSHLISQEILQNAIAKIAVVNDFPDPNVTTEAELIALATPLEPSTILVVDDNQSNLDLLSWQIKAQKHQVVTANNGKDALEKIATGNYDLILLDILMPEINGYQVLQYLRNSQWRHIPIIMISALDEIDSVVKCIEMGAEDYLPKPFNPTLLKARINACLEKKRLRDREFLFLSQLTQANQQITHLNERLKAENNRLSAELEITQRLQTMLLPKEKELSLINDLEIAGFMKSADEVGGDYYDVLYHNGRIKIGIGDVTGHGLESGVLMLMVQTAVRTLMESNQTDPRQFLTILNRTIYKNVQRMNCDKNLTLCLVDYQDGNLTLSGQHEEIVVVSAKGKIQRIDTVDLGFPIGLEEDIADFICHAEIQLNVGDVVVLYTDGITEAENNLGEYYGLERLCKMVQKNYQSSAKEIRKRLIQDLHQHIGNHKIYDDITLVIIKQKSLAIN
jgi:serine phosphatase RsbU (regulator of sigma subunit)